MKSKALQFIVPRSAFIIISRIMPTTGLGSEKRLFSIRLPSRLAVGVRLLVRDEEHFQMIKTLFDCDRRALLQAEGEHNIIVALLDPHVREAVRARARVDESGARYCNEDALALYERPVIVERRVGRDGEPLAVGHRSAPEHDDSFPAVSS
jgi:hypothetical protein